MGRGEPRGLDSFRCGHPRVAGAHDICQRQETSQTESYTAAMARRVLSLITIGPCGEIGDDAPERLALVARRGESEEQPLDMSYASSDGLVDDKAIDLCKQPRLAAWASSPRPSQPSPPSFTPREERQQ